MESNDILKLIIDYVEKHGVGKGLLVGGILILFYLLTKTSIMMKILDFIKDRYLDIFKKSKSENKDITESDISNHDIFNYIDLWLYSKIPTFQYSTQFRTVVFRKYLKLYLLAYKDELSNYVSSKKYEAMDDAELWNSLIQLINNIIKKYESEMTLAGIPPVVIEKMKVKNSDIISLTIDLLEGICNSKFHTSDKNRIKIYSILNILLSILENTIFNSESVCNSINGQLAGLQFEGQTEPTKH